MLLLFCQCRRAWKFPDRESGGQYRQFGLVQRIASPSVFSDETKTPPAAKLIAEIVLPARRRENRRAIAPSSSNAMAARPMCAGTCYFGASLGRPGDGGGADLTSSTIDPTSRAILRIAVRNSSLRSGVTWSTVWPSLMMKSVPERPRAATLGLPSDLANSEMPARTPAKALTIGAVASRMNDPVWQSPDIIVRSIAE